MKPYNFSKEFMEEIQKLDENDHDRELLGNSIKYDLIDISKKEQTACLEFVSRLSSHVINFSEESIEK